MAGKHCSLCNSAHCPEANMDETEGCCICYNENQIAESRITLCASCKIYAKIRKPLSDKKKIN